MIYFFMVLAYFYLFNICFVIHLLISWKGNRGIGFFKKDRMVSFFLSEVISDKKDFHVLYSQDAALKELMLSSGDTLLLTEGKLPPLVRFCSWIDIL